MIRLALVEVGLSLTSHRLELLLPFGTLLLDMSIQSGQLGRTARFEIRLLIRIPLLHLSRLSRSLRLNLKQAVLMRLLIPGQCLLALTVVLLLLFLKLLLGVDQFLVGHLRPATEEPLQFRHRGLQL